MTDSTVHAGVTGACNLRLALLAAVTAIVVAATSLPAQTDGTCVPVTERAGRAFGCFTPSTRSPPSTWKASSSPA